MAAFSRWDYDLVTCTLTLSEDGRSRILEFDPIATYVRNAKEWLWVWANDSFPEPARNLSDRLRELYPATQYRIFDQAGFKVTEHELDELCALAVDHLDASGLFRVNHDETTLLLAVRMEDKKANKTPKITTGISPPGRL